MRQRRRWMVAMSCATAVALSGCAASTNGPPASGDRVTLRMAASTQSGGYPTPFAAVRGPGALITTFMFDQLGFPDSTGTPQPWLASSWESSPDGKTWTFHLHPNAKWQDGQPLTADDVVFSFDYVLKGPGAGLGLLPSVNYISGVTAPDPSTVVVTLTGPHASFLSDVTGPFGVPIVPKHIWSTVTDPARFQGPQALVGSGPYRLASFDVTTNTFRFVANDGFYLGPPKVKELQVVKVGDPLLALQRGDLDAASAQNSVIPQSQFDTLSKTYHPLIARGEFNEALFFNLDAGFPYNQTAFRQAVAYALNRPDMLNRLASGRGVPGSAGGLGPANPYLNPNVQDYPFDPDRAKALLNQLGFVDRNGDGMREAPDGSPFAVPLLTSSSDNQQAQLVSEYLRAVGLRVAITAVDQPTSDARDGKGDYQLAVIHFGGLSGDPTGLVPRFASTSKSQSFTRVHGYRNPTFDQLAAQQATTVNQNQRRQLVDQMQAILAQDVPELPLYIPDQVTFVNDKVFGGWGYTPGCPPCGAGMNKRNLVTGSAAPVGK